LFLYITKTVDDSFHPKNHVMISCLIIYMKTFLNSDWLRAVQFFRNTVSKNKIQCKFLNFFNFLNFVLFFNFDSLCKTHSCMFFFQIALETIQNIQECTYIPTPTISEIQPINQSTNQPLPSTNQMCLIYPINQSNAY
jgi:hypothetical protein